MKLINKNFSLLWSGSLVSIVGTQCFLIAQAIAVKQITNSGMYVGLVMCISHLPIALFAPFAGVLADKVSNKKIIVISDIISSMTLFLLFLSWFISKDPNIRLYSILIASFFISLSAAFFQPASFAIIPKLVKKNEIQNANAIMSATENGVQIFGRFAGGALYAIIGPMWLFLVDSISYLLSSIQESGISENSETQVKKSIRNSSILSVLIDVKLSVKEGFAFILKSKPLLYFSAILGIVNIFFMPIFVALPFLIENSLKLNTIWYGYTLGAGSIGAFLASIFVSNSDKIKITKGPIFKGSLLILLGINIVLAGITSSKYILCFSFFSILFFLTTYNIFVLSQVQKNIPQNIIGRFFGFLTLLNAGTIPLANFFSGIILDYIGDAKKFFIYIGVLFIISTALPLLSKNYKRFLNGDF